MKKIICLNNISPVGLNALPKDYQITKEMNEADAVLVRSANMLETTLPHNVVAVARAGAGVNNIPLEPYAKAGVVVFNTPGANANAVRELTLAGMLLAARDLFGGMKWVEANKGDVEINKNMEKAKAAFGGFELLGKTIGIIGLGAVGASIAQAAAGIGMNVIGYESAPEGVSPKNKAKLPPNIVFAKSIDEVYAVADYLSLNVPLLPATKGMINEAAIAKMKPGVVILNLARDAIVNDADIKVALAAKKVRKYVTDFPNHETANMEGVIALPHLGASTEEAEDNCALMAALQIVDFIENGNIVNSVNYPNVELGPKTSAHRLVVLHDKKENLGQDILKEVLKKAKIVASISKVKGNFGVTLVDFIKNEKDCTEKACLADLIAALEGVIRVRVIH